MFHTEALAFVDWLKIGPAAPGVPAVQLAGEPERAARAKRKVDGIWVDTQTWDEIVAAGRKVGVVLAD